MSTPPPGPLDLVIRGGRVIEPADGRDGLSTSASGHVVAVEPALADGFVARLDQPMVRPITTVESPRSRHPPARVIDDAGMTARSGLISYEDPPEA